MLISEYPTKKRVRSFDNTEIYYELDNRSGSNKYLILLHGLGGDLSCWQKEMEALWDKGYSTIAVDLRGHGLSGRPSSTSGYTLTTYAHDIEAIVKAEKIKDFILIGHCFGGIISLVYAGIFPLLIRALILVDASYKAPLISLSQPFQRYLQASVNLVSLVLPNLHLDGHMDPEKFPETSDFDMRRIISDIAHVSLKNYLSIWSNLLSYDASSWLGKINIPTLIIEGEKDSVIPYEVAKELHSRIIHSQLIMVKGANHIIILNNPVELVGEIVLFLQKVFAK